jgi:hypothetical protein
LGNIDDDSGQVENQEMYADAVIHQPDEPEFDSLRICSAVIKYVSLVRQCARRETAVVKR